MEPFFALPEEEVLGMYYKLKKKKKKVIINEGQSMQCKPRLPLITIVHGVRKHDSKTKYGYQRTLQIFKTASDYAR